MKLAEDLAPLEAWLSAQLGGVCRIHSAKRLSGGAIQQNWLLRLDDAAGTELVLRRDAAAGVAESHGRAAEFALLRAAQAAGVMVPAPMALCTDRDVVGGPFLLMAKCEGIGFGPRVVKDLALAPDREALAGRLGAELARLHRIAPPRPDLAFLGPPPDYPAQAEIDRVRAGLDALGAARPGLEWALRWAERHAPATARVVLTHRDFRTGNYLVDARGLSAILDWEFAGWGDPMADLGWFCAACWRFGRADLEAGGIAPRAPFYAGYEEVAGTPVDDAAVRYWEVVAHLRWATIALAQGWRHGSGVEPSLELALTGRLAAELELTALRATAPRNWRDGAAGTLAMPEAGRLQPKPEFSLHPETAGSALLDIAQRTLNDAVLPAVSGDARYAALMVAAAIRMAAREAELGAWLAASAKAVQAQSRGETMAHLVTALRAGRHDADPLLHGVLWADAALRTSIAKPSVLTPTERRVLGLAKSEGPA